MSPVQSKGRPFIKIKKIKAPSRDKELIPNDVRDKQASRRTAKNRGAVLLRRDRTVLGRKTSIIFHSYCLFTRGR